MSSGTFLIRALTNARDNDPLVIPLWIVAGFLVVMSMYLAARILIPLSISLMLACLVSPATRWLRRTTGMGAAPSALVCLTALVAVLVVATIWSVVGISGLTSADALKDIRVRVVHMVTSEDWLKPFFPNPKELEESMGRIFAPSAGGALHNVGPVLVDSVLVVFMTFFFLAEGDWLLEKMALLFGQTADGKRRVADTFERIGRQIVRFMMVRTLVNIGLGLFLAPFLYVLGVPYWPAWCILAAVLAYVPYVGPVISAVPPVLFLLIRPEADGGPAGAGALVILLLVYAVAFTLEGYVALPLFLGHSLDLNATTVMIGCLFFWLIWGEVGLVMAIPFTAAIKLALAEVHGLRYWSDLMSAG